MRTRFVLRTAPAAASATPGRLGVALLTVSILWALLGWTPIPSASASLEGVLAPAGVGASQDSEDIALGTVDPGSGLLTFDSSVGFEMVGLSWEQGTIEAETRSYRDGVWTEWLELEELGGGELDAAKVEQEGGDPLLGAGPAWLGSDQQRSQIRVLGGSASGVTLHLVDTEPGTYENAGSSNLQSLTSAASATFVDPNRPAIVSRSAWGANESYKNCSSSIASRLDRAAVHHTVSTNNYTAAQAASLVRGIYYYHTRSLGWCDIGYNFLVDKFGKIYEGRSGGIDRPVVGAHSSGFNTYAMGVAVIGEYSGQAVPRAVINSVTALIGWKFLMHGIDPTGTHRATSGGGSTSRWSDGTTVTLNNIVGHRDTSFTECPGSSLYSKLGFLRIAVAYYLWVTPPIQRLMCDLDGDGDDTPVAFRRGGKWWISNDLNSSYEQTFTYGRRGAVGLCGDWNGDGRDTLGYRDAGVFYLRHGPGPGRSTQRFAYGSPGDVPITGDWNGDGRDSVGLVRKGGVSRWYFNNQRNSGPSDVTATWGRGSDDYVIGDWDGDGSDSPGISRNGSFFLSNRVAQPSSSYRFTFGARGQTATGGSWRSGSNDSIGAVVANHWRLRNSKTSGGADTTFSF